VADFETVNIVYGGAVQAQEILATADGVTVTVPTVEVKSITIAATDTVKPVCMQQNWLCCVCIHHDAVQPSLPHFWHPLTLTISCRRETQFVTWEQGMAEVVIAQSTGILPCLSFTYRHLALTLVGWCSLSI
jgi:hypothetical protein